MLERRKFMEMATIALSGAMAMLVGIPIVGYLLAPAFRNAARKRIKLLDDIGQLKSGEPMGREYIVERKDGWVTTSEVRRAYILSNAEGGLVVFSSICTHAGCSVDWKGDAFVCPCHDGRFDLQGRRVGGPPPRPLVRLPHQLEGNQLFIVVEA